MEETTKKPEQVGDWTLVCHSPACLWIGKVCDVYTVAGLLLKCPGCGAIPQTNGFMRDYADWLKHGGGKVKRV